MDGEQEIDAACHCGTVRLRVRLTDGLRTARRCTCSLCRMRGAVAVSADLDRLGLAHRAIGQVVAAGGEERVRIG